MYPLLPEIILIICIYANKLFKVENKIVEKVQGINRLYRLYRPARSDFPQIFLTIETLSYTVIN